MRRIRVIGIGAGHPEYLTVQAIAALNEVDVFFVADKGDTKDDLVELRRISASDISPTPTIASSNYPIRCAVKASIGAR
ncbi:Probable tetrapyrrole methylase family protein [Mycobacteroides abscessus]|nr:Probable tetrapyrrole methylase family protein [Mycobacteroides abscessus]